MCELFGMSSATPARAHIALSKLRMHGGRTADNPDGWGLAYLENGRFRLYKEPVAGASSVRFAQLGENVCSELILAHVRKARYPRVNTLDNTHPFMQSCCGRQWVFAHNGLVPEVVEAERANQGAVCWPGGETDSEHAFCHLLSEIARCFNTVSPGDGGDWFQALAAVSEIIASSGKFNFLLSDGEHLIAYGHDRLHYTHGSAQDALTALDVDLVMVATEPLTTEDSWHAFEPGELRVFRAGRLVGQWKTRPRAIRAVVSSLPVA